MSDEDFKYLVEQLKEGKNQCLKFIFEEHSEFCITNLQRKTGCILAEAEDIFMDALINFREKAIAGKITYMSNIRNYIYTTCLNMQRVNLQAQKRAEGKKEEVIMFFQPSSEDLLKEEGMADYTESLIEINMIAFSNLGIRCREILTLFYVDKLKMGEIATKLGFSSANVVKTSKSRCYKKWMESIKALQNASKSTKAKIN